MFSDYRIFVQRVKIENGFDLGFAYKLASHIHKGQLRKYTKEPLIKHSERVSKIIYNISRDPKLSVAGLLHDSIEKTPTTFSILKSKTDLYIASIVNEISINSNTTITLTEQLSTMSDEALVVKLCEIYDNLQSILLNEGYPLDKVREYIKSIKVALDKIDRDNYTHEHKVLISLIRTTINYIINTIVASGAKL